MNSKSISSVKDVLQKLEYYCSYQERCHLEVAHKINEFNVTSYEKESIIVHLIATNYLNEERFACAFSTSKFHQKKWGKVRIVNELKARKISSFLISQALKSINKDEYEVTFTSLSEKCWENITEKNTAKKRKKFCDYLLRKGWESDLVYSKLKEMEKL